MSDNKDCNGPKESSGLGCQHECDQKITTYNKEGALASKEDDNLADALRFVLVIPKYQFSDILKAEHQSIFANIANQLDPRSFAKLARTCKATHELCFNSKGVKINHEIGWIMVSTKFDSLRFRMFDVKKVKEKNNEFRPLNYSGKKFGYLGSAQNRKKLEKYPFVIGLNKLYINGALNTKSITEIRPLLAEFRIKTVSEIYTERIDDWDGFVQFVKEFGIKRVDALFVSFQQRLSFMGVQAALRFGHPWIPDGVANYFLQNLDHFHCNVNMPDRLLINAPVKTVRLTKTEISKDAFVALLKRFSNSTEEINWRLGAHDDFDFDHYNVFKTVSFRRKGALPTELPVILTTSEEDLFKVLRKDGKYLLVYSDGPNVVFSTSSNRGAKPDYDEYDTDDEVAGELEGVFAR